MSDDSNSKVGEVDAGRAPRASQLRALLASYQNAERQEAAAERAIDEARLAKDCAAKAKRILRDEIGQLFGWPTGGTDGVLAARVQAVVASAALLDGT